MQTSYETTEMLMTSPLYVGYVKENSSNYLLHPTSNGGNFRHYSTVSSSAGKTTKDATLSFSPRTKSGINPDLVRGRLRFIVAEYNEGGNFVPISQFHYPDALRRAAQCRNLVKPCPYRSALLRNCYKLAPRFSSRNNGRANELFCFGGYGHRLYAGAAPALALIFRKLRFLSVASGRKDEQFGSFCAGCRNDVGPDDEISRAYFYPAHSARSPAHLAHIRFPESY